MKTDHIRLPDALCASPYYLLLLNKAFKRSAFEFNTVLRRIYVPRGMTDGDRGFAMASEAARLGCLIEEVDDILEENDPFVFYFGDRRLNLRLPAGLCDWHAHTQFAYCGRGIALQDAADFSLALGTEVQGFAEHDFALYFDRAPLKFGWQSDPDYVKSIWDTPERGRMTAYKALVARARKRYGSCVKFGMEVDLFDHGRLCVAPEDIDGWDYLIGAVHEIQGIDPHTISDAELEKVWLSEVDRLLEYPIRILAHPFRYFPWYKRIIPRHLYRPIAKRLAQTGIAAEINHHANPFEDEFFFCCLEEGAKISLGTDAHITRDIADFLPHLRTLEHLGVGPDVLWRL